MEEPGPGNGPGARGQDRLGSRTRKPYGPDGSGARPGHHPIVPAHRAGGRTMASPAAQLAPIHPPSASHARRYQAGDGPGAASRGEVMRGRSTSGGTRV